MPAGERRTCRQEVLSFAKHTSPIQTARTAHHDDRAPFLPTSWGNCCPLPDERQGFGCFRLDSCWPHPLVLSANGITQLGSAAYVLFHPRTGWSDIYQEQSMVALYCPINALTWSGRGLIGQSLPGSKFTVKTMNRHLPKPVPWSFLTCLYTLGQESQVIWSVWAGQGKTKSSVTRSGKATPLQCAH